MPTLEAMKIKPADLLGPVLTSRGRASVLRTEIEDALAAGVTVVLDFSDVQTMSPSFADDLLAKLDPAAVDSGAVKVTNLPASVKPLARYLASHRHPRTPA